MPSGDCFTFAEDDGLIEPLVDLGEPVASGQPVARIHRTTRTGLDPIELTATLGGILAARHFPGLVAAMAALPVASAILDGEAVVEDERGIEFAARQQVGYACPQGHVFEITMSDEAVVPATWECPRCGA